MDAREDELDIYLDLTGEEIIRLVFCLLAEEMLKRRLAEFRRPAPTEWTPAPPVSLLPVSPVSAP